MINRHIKTRDKHFFYIQWEFWKYWKVKEIINTLGEKHNSSDRHDLLFEWETEPTPAYDYFEDIKLFIAAAKLRGVDYVLDHKE